MPPVPSVSLPVPFVPQPPDHCGPAALLMVARYHGLAPDPDALDDATYLPALEGTTPEVLLHAAQTLLGCPSARLLPLSPDDPQPLFDAVNTGIPPILFLAPPDNTTPDTRGHFLVVVGYQPSTRNLLVHTGNTPSRPLPPSRYPPRLRTALLLPPPSPLPPGL